MPLYEYECKACGERTEAIQAFSDAPLTVCPTCGGVLVKLLSPPAIQFKGSGFYLTDYGKSGASAGEKTGEKSSSKGHEGKAPGASGSGEASGSGAGNSDSSKGRTGEGAAGAAPSTPVAPPPSSPSKEKGGDKK